MDVYKYAFELGVKLAQEKSAGIPKDISNRARKAFGFVSHGDDRRAMDYIKKRYQAHSMGQLASRFGSPKRKPEWSRGAPGEHPGLRLHKSPGAGTASAMERGEYSRRASRDALKSYEKS